MLEPNIDRKKIVWQFATMYANNGLYVLPLRAMGKLLPQKKYNVSYGSASKNLDQINEWFDPKTGTFAGWNIGIACGKADGVFAVDQDVESWPDSKNIPKCPTQITPRGGRHYLMNWREGAINSTSKIYEGVDTRGGTVTECKGHIVVEPSVTDVGYYKWEKGVGFNETPDTPNWVMDLMGDPWKQNIKEPDKIEDALDVDQIRRMLKSMDIDSLTYEDWLMVGQSVNSQYPGEDGLLIWEEWSKTGSRYVKGECYIRWSGFNPAKGVRVGTLYHYAIKNGWEPEKGDKKLGKFDAMVEQMNQTYGIVLVGGKLRVLKERHIKNDIIEPNFDLLGVNDFKSLLENDVMWIDGKAVPVSKIWLAHEGRRTYNEGMGLYPDGKAPEGKYNTWSGLAIKPAIGDCSFMLNHIMTTICKNDKFLNDWFLDWCADAVQDPSDPKGCSIVMRGIEGAGKGVIGNLMCDIFGSHSRHLIDDAHLLSNFNAHMIDALFVFADEITWGGNVRTAGKLKGMVTERFLVGERKGIDAVAYRNMIHMMISSNSDWIVPAGANSRRWFVLDVSGHKAVDRSYFDDMHQQLDNGGREAFLYFLLNREITSDLRRAPETEGLKSQRLYGMSQDNTAEWWIEVLTEGKMYVSSSEVLDDLHSDHRWVEKCDMMELFKSYKEWSSTSNGRMDSVQVWRRKMTEIFNVEIRGREMNIGKYEDCCDVVNNRMNLELGK